MHRTAVSGCKCGDKCKISDTLGLVGSPSRKSKKSCGKGSVALLNEAIQLGCVSHDSPQRKSLSSRRPRCVTQIFGKRRVHRRESFKNANLRSESLWAPNFEERTQMKLSGKSGAPAEQPGKLGSGCLQTQEGVTRNVLLSCRCSDNAGTFFDKPRRATVRNRL